MDKEFNLKSSNYLIVAFSCLVPLFSILAVYEIPVLPISITEIVLIAFIIFSFYSNQLFLKQYSLIYIVFLLYGFMSSIILSIGINYWMIDDWFFKWARIFIYSYTLLILTYRYLDLSCCVKMFQYVGCIVSIVQILQSVMWYIFKIPIVFIIPGAKLHYSISEYSEYINHIMNYGGALWRPSNLFLEPAHFTQFGIIALICCLFIPRNPKMHYAVLISLAIFLSGSGLGVFSTIIVWILFNIGNFNKKSIRYYLFGLLVIISIIIFLVLNEDYFQGILYRFGTVSDSGSSTGTLRLLRGISIYSQLPILYQIFGTGFGNLKSYLIGNGITTIYDGDMDLGNEYMNTFSFILVNTGIIGFVLFILFIAYLLFYCKEFYKKVLLFCWGILCLGTSNFLSYGYILPLMMLMATKKRINNGEDQL